MNLPNSKAPPLQVRPSPQSKALNGRLAGVDTRRTRSRKEYPPLDTDPPLNASRRNPSLERAYPPSITRLRKRQSAFDGESARNSQKRVRLTRENLAYFNVMSGTKAKDASDPPTGDTHTGDTTTKATSTSTTSASSGFIDKAKANGILPLYDSQRPTNFEDLHANILRQTDLDSATESEFKYYRGRVCAAPNESTIFGMTSGLLLKRYHEEENDDSKYFSFASQQFTGFPVDVGFNKGLSPPQPDFVEGFRDTDFRPFPINAVSGAVLYRDKPFALTLPHIAGEWKAYGGNIQRADYQSGYDGAALVYARTQALKYLGEGDPPGEAKVLTFITNGANLVISAHYAAPDADGALKYHQYHIKTQELDSYAGFRKGRRMLRNAQDFAKKQSEILRDKLKRHGNNPPKLLAIGSEKEGEHQPSDNSSDEEATTPPPEPSIIQSRKRGASAASPPRRKRGRPPKKKADRVNSSSNVRENQNRGRGAAAGPRGRGRGRPPQRAR
ncbi:putative heterokaryon incompatibility [Rosellinia necatrix]|uniref:Putative heterokaryon incompatibility n=1 Tax=Rosellinia necatrix TaxID=77044 RepID=A0A1S7UIY2_ROSNE|nr:putative heterokaryon incompatibility [Rosellinia necatrix]